MISERSEFLLHMYDQFLNDVNRHILLGWQSLTIIGGSIVVIAASEKGLFPLNYAVSVVVVLLFWGINVIIDSNHWYVRNIAVIANIERQFLKKRDLREIHPYFGEHRKPGFIHIFKIQFILLIILLFIFLIYYSAMTFKLRFVTNFEEFMRSLSSYLPFALTLFGVLITWRFWNGRQNEYVKFLKSSPGRRIPDSSRSQKVRK